MKFNTKKLFSPILRYLTKNKIGGEGYPDTSFIWKWQNLRSRLFPDFTQFADGEGDKSIGYSWFNSNNAYALNLLPPVPQQKHITASGEEQKYITDKKISSVVA